jgi:capsular exopolysaccharide synthesis family protein
MINERRSFPLVSRNTTDAVPYNAAAKWHEQRVKSAFAMMGRRLWLIAAFSIVGLGAAALYLAYAKPQYSATALVQLDTHSKYSNFDSVVSGPREGDPIAIRTEVEVLRSEAIAERVVKALGLTEDPEFKPQPHSRLADLLGDGLATDARKLLVSLGLLQDVSDEDELALTTKQVRRHLSVDADGRSYIVTISFSASNADKAAKIANAFAEQYLASQIDAKTAITAKANEWAKSQLDTAGEQLREAEAAVEQFRAKHNEIVEVGPGNSVAAAQQLAQINALLASATEARIAAETRLAAAKKLAAAGDVYAIPEVLSSRLIQQLRVEEARATARRASLQSRLGVLYPDLKAADNELSHIRGSVNEEVKKIVASLGSDVQFARAREDELAAKVQALRKDVGDVSRLQFQLANLERRADARRTFYSALEKRYVETSALLHGVYADARIVASATPQPLRSWPNVPVVIAAGLLLGAALGAALAALLELADKSFRTPPQLEEATGLACLGILPEMGHALRRTIGGDLSSQDTRLFREAVRSVCIAMDAAVGLKANKAGRVVVVTSAVPEEGKTVSSVALATALAARGSRTLLIDADLRRPQVGGYLDVVAHSRDLAAILADGEGCQAATAVADNLYVIRGGEGHENAQQVFLSPQFGTFLEAARTQFDAIIVDSPPVMIVADAAVLARFADVVLHVIRWGRTRRSMVLDAINRMRRANGEAVGVTMLNRVDLSKYRKYNRDSSWSFKYSNYYQPAIGVAGKKQLR